MTGPYDQLMFGPCFWCGRETFRTGPNTRKPYTYTRDHLIVKKLRRVSLQKVTGKLAHQLTVTCCLECNSNRGGQSAYRFAAQVRLTQEKMKVIHRAYALNQRGSHAH